MTAAGIRTARAVIFTALCVTLSTGAHVLLSGSPVPLPTLVAVTAAVFLVAFALADRERGYVRIAALLIPLELFADTVFTSGQHACYGHSGGPVTGPLRALGIDVLCAGGEVGTPLAKMSSMSPGGSLAATVHDSSPWLLLAAHVMVCLLAAAWLRRGEAAVARLLHTAAVTAFRPLLLAVLCCRFVVRETGVRPTAPVTVRTPRLLTRLAHSVLRRGPPDALASAA